MDISSVIEFYFVKGELGRNKVVMYKNNSCCFFVSLFGMGVFRGFCLGGLSFIRGYLRV